MSFVLALVVLLCLSAEMEQPKRNILHVSRSNRGTGPHVEESRFLTTGEGDLEPCNIFRSRIACPSNRCSWLIRSNYVGLGYDDSVMWMARRNIISFDRCLPRTKDIDLFRKYFEKLMKSHTPDGTVCSVDEHVLNNKCTQCAPGSTQVAGDNAMGPDTACTGTVCSSNEYVLNHVCTKCASGSTTAAGDKAMGPDTACTDTICSLDEYVLNHVCAQCAPRYKRDQGDKATGPDTECLSVNCLRECHSRITHPFPDQRLCEFLCLR